MQVENQTNDTVLYVAEDAGRGFGLTVGLAGHRSVTINGLSKRLVTHAFRSMQTGELLGSLPACILDSLILQMDGNLAAITAPPFIPADPHQEPT